MLSIARPTSRHIPSLIRSFATESVPHTPNVPPSPSIPDGTKPRPSRLHPRPRPATRNQSQTLPVLPPSFGRNQLLPVPNSTRALLEDIVNSFEAPIRYAFAYGSGVFEQAGYDKPADAQAKGTDGPMLDFVFAVAHPDHWHSINMHQFPGHYSLPARAFGSSLVSQVQALGPGLWYNMYVPMHGVMIKYGVTTVDTLCADLLNWRTLFLAGRMHKPIRIIRDDARVRLTQQVNLTSALRTALLTLPAQFTQRELFTTIAGISYAGDLRMVFPAENRGKVTNIVRRQEAQFRELYWQLAQGLPGVRWRVDSEMIEQDTSAHARAAHLKKLPEGLLTRIHGRARGRGPPTEADECAYWLRIAGDEALPSMLRSGMSNIVRYPATVQALKGLPGTGLIKSARYAADKVGKYWKGLRTNSPGASS